MNNTSEDKNWVVEKIEGFWGEQKTFFAKFINKMKYLASKDRVYTTNKPRTSRIAVWTIEVWSPPPSELNCREVCVAVPYNTPDVRAQLVRRTTVCKGLPFFRLLAVLLKYHYYCLMCSLYVLLTTVQFYMETLFCLSSFRRWYWTHWIIHKYKCTFQNFVLLIMLSSYQGEELHILRISYSCHKV